MNSVFLKGNLTADPEVRTYSGDRSFTTFTIAVESGWGDNKKTHFIPCVSFGKTGENLAKFYQKGSVFVGQGELYGRKTNQGNQLGVKITDFYLVFSSRPDKPKPKTPPDEESFPF